MFSILSIDLEGRHELVPGSVCFGDRHLDDGSHLEQVGNLKFFHFKISIEGGEVELAEVCKRVPLRKVFLLDVINAVVCVHLRAITHVLVRILDKFENWAIARFANNILELSELLGLFQISHVAGVKVTKIIGKFLQNLLSFLGLTLFIHRVVKYL